MKTKHTNLILSTVILAVLLSACSHVTEVAKVVWGSSTKALEEARSDGVSKTYSCSLSDCFDAVLALARTKRIYVDYKFESEKEEGEEETDEVIAEEKKVASGGHFDVFIKDRRKRHIVVMGIEGNVDTTEVGIFFSQPKLTTVKLDVSSLSSSAKRTVSEIIFSALDAQFSAAE